jgi:hypothetical protein
MKLYLASFFQPENHGPGKVISISVERPKGIEAAGVFVPFAPTSECLNTYRREQLENQQDASNNFVSSYKSQLDNFMNELDAASAKTGSLATEVLPFEEGDTLASWERGEFTNYRRILAEYLHKIGYEVELH